MTELPSLISALLAGLLGSGHCFAMCGAIAAAAGLERSGGAAAATPVLVFNAGRMLSYALLGAAVAAVVAYTGARAGIPAWGAVLRLLAALLIFLIGLQFLTGMNLLGPLERLGARLWALARPLASRTARFPPLTARFLLGMCWGLLPCGLVYTMLLLAASSGTPGSGALVMLAFGLGTLPAMLGMGVAAGSIAMVLRDRFVRRFIGLGLVLLAGWSALTVVSGWPGGHMH